MVNARGVIRQGPDSHTTCQCKVYRLPYAVSINIRLLNGISHASFGSCDSDSQTGHDERQGTQNACNRCHQERGLKWQKDAYERLFGSIKPQPKLLCAFSTRQGGDNSTISTRFWARWTVERVSRRFGQITFTCRRSLSTGRINRISNQGIEHLKTLTNSTTLDVRAAALTTLLVLATIQPSLAEYCWTHIERDAKRAFQLRLKVQHNLISLFRAFELARSGGTGRLRSTLELALPILNIDPTRWPVYGEISSCRR